MNSNLIDSKICDFDLYNKICEETKLNINNVDTIYGSIELENKKIFVSQLITINHVVYIIYCIKKKL